MDPLLGFVSGNTEGRQVGFPRLTWNAFLGTVSDQTEIPLKRTVLWGLMGTRINRAQFLHRGGCLWVREGNDSKQPLVVSYKTPGFIPTLPTSRTDRKYIQAAIELSRVRGSAQALSQQTAGQRRRQLHAASLTGGR